MAKTKPDAVWAAQVNMSGLYSPRPLRLKWHNGLKEYCNDDIGMELGLDTRNIPGRVTFSSESKREVEIFIAGVCAAMQFINWWSDVPGRKIKGNKHERDG